MKYNPLRFRAFKTDFYARRQVKCSQNALGANKSSLRLPGFGPLSTTKIIHYTCFHIQQPVWPRLSARNHQRFLHLGHRRLALGRRCSISWFSDIITKDVEDVLPPKREEHEGQQTFESLSLLVATRLWSLLWRQKRVRLCVRSDNRGALSSFSN